MKLSILVPVYNEEALLPEALKRTLAVEYGHDVEFVVVDDGSSDRTPDILSAVDDPRIRVIRQDRNMGKGAAVRIAAEHATGDFMVIFDADLEYDPADIPRMFQPVRDGRASVVFGSRTLGSHSAFSFWYVMGNKVVTTAANIAFNSYLSDLETCLKLMPLRLFLSLDIRSPGFGMEAEVTCKLLRQGIRPYEIPISYIARSRGDGKKITWKDGVAALRIILTERVRRPRPAVPETS